MLNVSCYGEDSEDPNLFIPNKKSPACAELFLFGGEGEIHSGLLPLALTGACLRLRVQKSPHGIFVELVAALPPRSLATHPSAQIKKALLAQSFFYLAEKARFELANGVTRYSLSKRAPSATRPPLRRVISDV